MTDWNKLKVVDLKAELKKRGLAQTGLKPALVSRLVEAESQEGSESEATIQDDAAKIDASAAVTPDAISPAFQPSGLSEEVLQNEQRSLTPEAPVAAADNQVDEANASIPDTVMSIDDTVISPASQGLGTLISASNDKHDSALPSAEPQEVFEDRQKRKRRSQSPPLSAGDAAHKRFKQDDGFNVSMGEGKAMEGESVSFDKLESQGTETSIDPIDQTIRDDGAGAGAGAGTTEIAMGEHEDERPISATDDVEGTRTTDDSSSHARSARYKDLFTSDVSQATAVDVSTSTNIEAEPDRIISPAIHPATASLYIRDFMRPLNPAQLKAHLAGLATPPGSDVDLDIITNFYLDPIRTHSFVSFANTSAASRVRNALHGKTWPEERTRKPLWIDFIPVEKVEDWIIEEQGSAMGGRAQSKKWEISYHTDEDRFVTVTLQEALGGPSQAQLNRQSSISSMPSQPVSRIVSIQGAPTGPRDPGNYPQRATANLRKLDELFKSTTAKPVLYFQPVDRRLADKRLDNIERALSKDALSGKRIGGDINRYTFEDGDLLVDRGPEIFPGIRPPPGYRGRRQDGPRRGFRGRGGYAGGSERNYDSYGGGRRNSRY